MAVTTVGGVCGFSAGFGSVCRHCGSRYVVAAGEVAESKECWAL